MKAKTIKNTKIATSFVKNRRKKTKRKTLIREDLHKLEKYHEDTISLRRRTWRSINRRDN